jgi:hypothetical protein
MLRSEVVFLAKIARSLEGKGGSKNVESLDVRATRQ